MKIAKDSLLTTRRIAHRGLHDNKTIPENSLAAFRNARPSNALAASGYIPKR